MSIVSIGSPDNPVQDAIDLLVVVLVFVAALVKAEVSHQDPEPITGLAVCFESEPPRKAYQHLEHGAAKTHPLGIHVVYGLVFKELLAKVPTIL